MQMIFVNTDREAFHESAIMIHETIDHLNHWLLKHDNLKKRMNFYHGCHTKIPLGDDWGYPETQCVLEELWHQNKCSHIMFTNGDNLYNKKFIMRLHPHLQNDIDMISFRFVCKYHHENKALDGEFEQSKVDLGAVVIKMNAT